MWFKYWMNIVAVIGVSVTGYCSFAKFICKVCDCCVGSWPIPANALFKKKRLIDQFRQFVSCIPIYI